MAWSKTYSGSEPVRVNKWLAEEGVCSRREAEALIADGLIGVDGTVLSHPGHKIAPGETLSLSERAEKRLEHQISLIYNKPEGIVSGTPEGDEIPAVRLITPENLAGKSPFMPSRANRLAPLGRLDKDSRGLLILSEDGVLAKAVIGPESVLDKEYVVKVVGDITPEKLDRLRHGLELDDRELKPALITLEDAQTLRIVLNEGRNRQIRRMCELVDLRVVDLVRVRIGPIALGGLTEGFWRPLSDRERTDLVAAEAPPARPPRPARRERPYQSDGDARPYTPRGDRPQGDRPYTPRGV
jgi:23S rRNA pseudouridine2604 synthase